MVCCKAYIRRIQRAYHGELEGLHRGGFREFTMVCWKAYIGADLEGLPWCAGRPTSGRILRVYHGVLEGLHRGGFRGLTMVSWKAYIGAGLEGLPWCAGRPTSGRI